MSMQVVQANIMLRNLNRHSVEIEVLAKILNTYFYNSLLTMYHRAFSFGLESLVAFS